MKNNITHYDLDTSHSTIEFSIRHLVIAKVRGRFTNFAGVIDLDPDDVTKSKVAVDIDAASISTNEAKRDAHLRSEDFFDVEKYPRIEFRSTRVEQDGHDLRVAGTLTMHGVTNEVVLRVEPLGSITDPYGKGRLAFSASTTIDRKAFGLQWNQLLETGGVMVGDKVEIALDIQAVRAEVQAAA
ncbi:MAG: YceI family protein [Kofleriaceae bacterium]